MGSVVGRIPRLCALAACFIAAGWEPGHAAPIDSATVCGAQYVLQVASIVRGHTYQWLPIKKTATQISVELVVYTGNTYQAYTGFTCAIAANGTVTAQQAPKQ